MTITRIAMPKAQALPSTVDERLAKIRKASLATQNKSRDSSSSLAFSFCVFIVLISLSWHLPQPDTELVRADKEMRRFKTDSLFHHVNSYTCTITQCTPPTHSAVKTTLYPIVLPYTFPSLCQLRM